MRRSFIGRVALVLTLGCLTTLSTTGTSLAYGPAQYCTSVLLASAGDCVHGGQNQVQHNQGRSTGQAWTCVGVLAGNVPWSQTLRGPYCTNTDGAWVYSPDYSPRPIGYPALHNHSPFQSRFEGLFYYGP